MSDTQPLAIVKTSDDDLVLSPVISIEQAQSRLDQLQKFVRNYLHENEDYGTIPGTPKPTLLKPGADKLCDIYALADNYEVTNRVEDWTRNLFDYEIRCTLTSKRTGGLVSTGFGSCNSYEGKYRWREQKRLCPSCGKPTILKNSYGPGWLCWKKEGRSDGCGTKFADDDTKITNQQIGKVENEDIPTLKNTILKMAKKRAKVDAVLSATRSSGLFTQDMEDIKDIVPDEPGSKQAAQAVAEQKITDLKKKLGKPEVPKAEVPTDLNGVLQDSIKKIAKAHGLTEPDPRGHQITKAEKGTGKTKDAMWIEYDGEKICVFDTGLFPYLKVGVWADMDLDNSRDKKYVRIARVYSIGDVKFDENNHPMREPGDDRGEPPDYDEMFNPDAV